MDDDAGELDREATDLDRARHMVVEDFLLRGMCSREEAEAEAVRIVLAPLDPPGPSCPDEGDG